MSTPKIVKRYANRKLYDTERSCYVTLDDISAMIKAGDEVRVIDNKSGEDLTTVTLAQIIFETEKKANFMPLSLLRNLIQQGESAFEGARERVVGSVQAKAEEIKTTAAKLRTGFEDKLSVIRPVGKSGEGGAASDEVAGAGTESGAVVEAGAATRSVKPKILELFNTSQRGLEELQRTVEDRLKGVSGSVARYATLGREMQDIRKRLAELEERLENISQ